MSFYVGDRVCLSIEGIREYRDSPDNPYEESGEVVSIDYNEDYPFTVVWDNGRENCYRDVELLTLPELVPKTKVKEKPRSLGFKEFARARL